MKKSFNIDNGELDGTPGGSSRKQSSVLSLENPSV